MSNSDAHQAPHRGAMILVLGILGIVFCQICAPIAWVLGKGDLAQIQAGTMDPQGEGLTRAGMVLGIVGTVLVGLTVLILVVFMVIGLFVGLAESAG